MSKEDSYAATHGRLIQAAEQIVLREGVARLTLDAVAREAGVSKGGVLYHFARKESLVAGMLAHLVERFEQDLRGQFEADAAESGRWVRAYTRATFQPEQAQALPSLTESAGLLAAVAVNPDLLRPFQERYREWQARIEEDGLAPALATLVRLAADGLWLADLLDLAPPTGALREQVLDLALRLTRPEKGHE